MTHARLVALPLVRERLCIWCGSVKAQCNGTGLYPSADISDLTGTLQNAEDEVCTIFFGLEVYNLCCHYIVIYVNQYLDAN